MKNEIILYRPDELAEHIEVRIEDETVWLNRNQIATLFGRDVKTIGKHINNVFKEGELEKEVVVAKFATTTQHGAIKEKTQTTITEHYNLDVIISVGYRVKSILFMPLVNLSAQLFSRFNQFIVRLVCNIDQPDRLIFPVG